jgi:hypothetical protein
MTRLAGVIAAQGMRATRYIDVGDLRPSEESQNALAEPPD